MRLFVALIFTFLFSPIAYAQSLATQLNEQETILISPEFPTPGEEVTVTLNNYSSFLSGASIEWSIDGFVVSEAANYREFKFTAGEVGVPMIIRATLTPGEGIPRYIETSVTPIYLDIVFEPQTHVPFFYEGRPLPSLESSINATALVDTGSLLNEDLVYLWRINQKVVEQGPIRGRNKISFEMPRGREALVFLQVSLPSGKTIARRSLYVPSVYPEMYFYEENALYGISTKAISRNTFILNNAMTLVAEPYNLDSRIFNSPDVSEWKIDGSQTTTPSKNPYKIVIQKTGEAASSRVSFHVRSLSQVLQGAENTITIKY